MKFCQPHWDQLRQKVDARGLTSLIADTGEQAAKNIVRELEEGERTIDTFDPLMGAHNAIWGNAMRIAQETYQSSPLAMLAGDPQHPEWECPVCFLNWLHADHIANCKQPGCDYPKEADYAWMLDRAVDEQAEEWKRLGGAA